MEEEYVQTKLNPLLEMLVTQVLIAKPNNPIPFMIDILRESCENGDSIQMPSVDNSKSTSAFSNPNQPHSDRESEANSSSESFDDESDDDDWGDLPDLLVSDGPKNWNSGSRAAISAEVGGDLNINQFQQQDWTGQPPCRKGKDTLSLLRDVIKSRLLFGGLEQHDVQSIVDSLQKKKFLANSTIVKSGSSLGGLLIIEKGSIDAYLDDELTSLHRHPSGSLDESSPSSAFFPSSFISNSVDGIHPSLYNISIESSSPRYVTSSSLDQVNKAGSYSPKWNCKSHSNKGQNSHFLESGSDVILLKAYSDFFSRSRSELESACIPQPTILESQSIPLKHMINSEGCQTVDSLVTDSEVPPTIEAPSPPNPRPSPRQTTTKSFHTTLSKSWFPGGMSKKVNGKAQGRDDIIEKLKTSSPESLRRNSPKKSADVSALKSSFSFFNFPKAKKVRSPAKSGHLVHSYAAFDAVGELDLLSENSSSVSLIARTDVTGWYLDRRTFISLMKHLASSTTNYYDGVLSTVSLFGCLTFGEITRLSEVVCVQYFEPGFTIVQQGCVNDRLSVVEEGLVIEYKVFAHGHSPIEVRRLKPGEWFGESGLFRQGCPISTSTYAAGEVPQTATATGTTQEIHPKRTKILAVKHKDFNRILGPLTDILLTRLSTKG